jgi:hypothetical protein
MGRGISFKWARIVVDGKTSEAGICACRLIVTVSRLL